LLGLWLELQNRYFIDGKKQAEYFEKEAGSGQQRKEKILQIKDTCWLFKRLLCNE
jgi:hypothetical protein